MGRWIAGAALVAALGVAGAGDVAPAGASSGTAGALACASNSTCDLASLGHLFPNYQNVCPLEDCGLVAAADWVSVGAQVNVGPAAVASIYSATGRRPELGTNLSALWQYWTRWGLGGIYLFSHQRVGLDESAVEAAVLSAGAVIAVARSNGPVLVGAETFGDGVADLVADGFTPAGPLVVCRNRTVQMTWGQWRDQVRAAWLPQVSTSPPAGERPVTFVAEPTDLPPAGGPVSLVFAAPGASSCSLASTPELFSRTPLVVPCSGSYQVSVAGSEAGRTWVVTFTSAWPGHVNRTASQRLTQFAPAPPTDNTSVNWSGYDVVSSGAPITEASGTFVVPTLNCADTPQGSVSVWVGVGGVNLPGGGTTGALLQTGIASSCFDGTQNNIGWWEIWPSTPNYTQLFVGFPVSAGDSIEASVFEQPGGAWETLMSDEDTGLSAVFVTGQSWGVGPTAPGTPDYTVQGEAPTTSYAGGSSAEWVVEDPVNLVEGAFYPLANFGAVPFSGLATSLTSWSLEPAGAYAILQQGVEIAAPTPTPLNSFVDTYYGP